MNILITSGGTKVPIDSVRYIGNMSSGRYGAQIADAFEKQDHNVLFWYASHSAIPNDVYIAKMNGRIDSALLTYKNYDEYVHVLNLIRVNKPDIIISAAAVSDYIVDKTEGKISSDKDELVIVLKKAQKILPQFKKYSPKSMVVGFKLLVSPAYQDVYAAVQKVLNNGADYVVYNDLNEIKKGNDSRLVFRKDMTFTKVGNAEQLTDFILNEYPTWLDR